MRSVRDCLARVTRGRLPIPHSSDLLGEAPGRRSSEGELCQALPYTSSSSFEQLQGVLAVHSVKRARLTHIESSWKQAQDSI